MFWIVTAAIGGGFILGVAMMSMLFIAGEETS